jgi:hypothetical protein
MGDTPAGIAGVFHARIFPPCTGGNVPRLALKSGVVTSIPALTRPAPVSDGASSAAYTGEVVYMYAFDVAYEMIRRPVDRLLGQPVAEFAPGAGKQKPRQWFFYRPQMVRLPPLERLTARGPVRVERAVKLLPVGAISITVRVPFDVRSLEDLVDYHDLHFADGTSLYHEVRQLADDVRRELSTYYIRPVEQMRDEEAYTVFCINSPPPTSERHADGSPQPSTEDWYFENRREIAALLTEERNPTQLSQQESDESTGRYYTYYRRDLAVIDWDAALIVDERQFFDETLYIMELANVQLAELEAYDRILDEAVERSYRDIAARRFRSARGVTVQQELREIRVDFARLSDELSNITKFFGDWHLARIYQGVSARFHLGDWHRTINEKLKTLDDLYQLLRAEQNNRWMLILEVSIVLMFLIDLVILAIGLRWGHV